MSSSRLTFLLVLVMIASPTLAATPTSQPIVTKANPPAEVEKQSIRRNVASDADRRGPATQSAAAALNNRSSSGPDLQRVLLALGIVMGAIFIARWVFKKMYPVPAAARNSQVIRILSRNVIGPKQQLMLVQIGKRLVLVGNSSESMNALAQIVDDDEVAALLGQLQSETSTSSVSAFSSLFRKAGNEFTQDEAKDLREQPAVEEAAEGAVEVDDAPARELVAAAGEITGLMDRVRSLSKRLRQT